MSYVPRTDWQDGVSSVHDGDMVRIETGIATKADAADVTALLNAVNRLPANLYSASQTDAVVSAEASSRASADQALSARIDPIAAAVAPLAGGTSGQVLTRTSSGGYAWQNATGGGGGGSSIIDNSDGTATF